MALRVSVNQVAFVNRALAHADREIKNGARAEILAIGKLVEHDVETFALSRIRNLPRSPEWADMRVGQNNELVYVVPFKRGSRRRPRKRSNFARLVQNRAMRPAKAKNEKEIVRRFDALTAKVCASFNH